MERCKIGLSELKRRSEEEGEGIVTYIGKCKAMTPHYRKGTYVRCDVCVSGGRRVGALDRGCRSNWREEQSNSSRDTG